MDRISYPSRFSTPVIGVNIKFPPFDVILARRRAAEEIELAYRKTWRGRIENRVRYWRGRLSDFIAPDGWNAE